MEHEFFIETQSGRKFDYTNINEKDIDIHDIANSLSKLCRFTGHSNSFYSVGMHSLILSELAYTEYQQSPKQALFYLLHDAHEAYCQDIATPLKNHLKEKKVWHIIESIQNAVDDIIFKKYGIEDIAQVSDHVLDKRVLINEKTKLFPGSDTIWAIQLKYTPFPDDVFDDLYHRYNFKSNFEIEELFLEKFHKFHNKIKTNVTNKNKEKSTGSYHTISNQDKTR